MNLKSLFQKSIPTFDKIPSIPQAGQSPILPKMSNNGIKGRWEYITQNDLGITYEFIPNRWEWAHPTILTVEFQKSKPSPPDHEYHLEYAFNCGGVDYFEFVDKNNLPFERGLEAITFYQELQNGVTNKYLKEHVAAMNKLFADPRKINLNEVIKLNARLEERLNYIISKEIVYKIASIAFVDKTENCARYDPKYNEKKIANWKENMGDNFFLSMPIKKLIPFLQKSGDSSLIYLKVVEKIEAIQHDIHSLQMLERELQTEKD